MLNPSTADASQDDPTLKRCVYFAKANGCNKLIITNLFSFRTPDPKLLKSVNKNEVNSEKDFKTQY